MTLLTVLNCNLADIMSRHEKVIPGELPFLGDNALVYELNSRMLQGITLT